MKADIFLHYIIIDIVSFLPNFFFGGTGSTKMSTVGGTFVKHISPYKFLGRKMKIFGFAWGGGD